MADLEKLRKVLDYVPSKEMANWRERSYYEALNRRLQRDVVVHPRAQPARATKSDAVRVVSPEDWAAAQEARKRQQEQELELARLGQREEELLAQIARLQQELARLRGQGPAPAPEAAEKLTRFELVGVRKAEPAPTWEVAPLPELEEEPVMEPAERDSAIRLLEEEIRRSEEELSSLSRQLRETSPQAEPYRMDDYTLYARSLPTKGKQRNLFYFFSREQPADAEAVPLPHGYKVAKNARTGLPYLKKSGAKSGGKRRR